MNDDAANLGPNGAEPLQVRSQTVLPTKKLETYYLYCA